MSKLLIKKLDSVFSLYIRNKYASGGYVSCYTCTKVGFVKEMQCGHFLSRRHLSVRWDENNVRPQCVSCNIFNQGQQHLFGKRLEKELGENEINKLLVKAKQPFRLGKFELETLIKFYKESTCNNQ